MQASEWEWVPHLGPVPAEEAAAVKPVGLLPVKEGGLNHGGQPHVTLRDFSFAALALGSPGLRVLRPVQARMYLKRCKRTGRTYKTIHIQRKNLSNPDLVIRNE